MNLTLDFTNCLASSIGATHGLTDAELDTLVAKFPRHHENIEDLRASGESAFFDLPYQDLTEVKALVKKHKGKWDAMVLIGTAGATIGPESLFKAHCPEHWNLRTATARGKAPKFFILNNADPRSAADLLETIDLKKTLFVVLSRSGNTAETNAVFLWLFEKLQALGAKAPAKHMIIGTDLDRSPLARLAQAEGIDTMPMPTNLSGRFSVLHACSLFPAAMIDIDIDALLAGAAAMDTRCRHDKAMQNPAYMHSLIHYLLTRKRRKTLHATMAFSNRLTGFVDWYNHLLAVSLGKMLNRKGKAVHVGPSPAQACGPAGSYGQMQLYQEGPFDKVTTFITVKDHLANLPIPSLLAEDENFAYLGGHDTTEIIDQAYIGAAQVITSAGRPNMTIELADTSEASLGGLYYMLELSTVMSAELYGIDAFDQPGVDANKQAIFAQLGRAGFEDKASILAEYRQRQIQSC